MAAVARRAGGRRAAAGPGMAGAGGAAARRGAAAGRCGAFFSDTNLVMSGCNIGMLALGRFVFLPAQRRGVEKAGEPSQTLTGPGNQPTTNANAGGTFFDGLAKETQGALQTNDPAGFTIIDTLAWGSLGHVIGMAILAGGSAAAGGIQAIPLG